MINHLERILIPQLLDVIYERFEQMTHVLTYTSFFYGGAVRDALAGIPLQGDLDITVANTRSERFALLGNIRNRAKEWKAIRINNTYDGTNSLSCVAEVINYVHKETRLQTQVVCSSAVSGDAISQALHVVSEVDIVCCGVALDCWGYVYEVVPGAIQHCKDRVLIVNKRRTENINNFKLTGRLIKLQQRGWRIVNEAK